MLNSDIFEYEVGLNLVSKVKGSSKFSYAVAKNIQKLTSEVEAIRAGFDQLAEEDQTEAQTYENARLEIVNKYSSKAGDFTIGDHLPFIEDKPGFFAELNTLQAGYSRLLGVLQDANSKVDAILKEEFAGKLDFHKVRAEDLPDGLAPSEVIAIDFMLE